MYIHLLMSVILEIVKLTLPALIVFLTVYYMLKQLLRHQQQQTMLELRRDQQEAALPLRMQAYERLSLFCERISLPSLLLRVRKEGMTAADLRVALLFTIQQEYEHNLTQQVYISRQLWDIIQAARDDVVNTISVVAEDIADEADGRKLAGGILDLLARRGVSGPEKALDAIRKEAGLLF